MNGECALQHVYHVRRTRRPDVGLSTPFPQQEPALNSHRFVISYHCPSSSSIINYGKQSVIEKSNWEILIHPDFWGVLASAANENSASFICFWRQHQLAFSDPGQVNTDLRREVCKQGRSLPTLSCQAAVVPGSEDPQFRVQVGGLVRS